MNRRDVRLLQAIRDYPAVSIILPTHRTSPDNKRDPILAKNLVTEAGNRLLGEFDKREVDVILKRMDDLVSSIDWERTLDGLALYINRDIARAFMLHFQPEPRVVIDDTFATRDLVRNLNRSERYLVLLLNEQNTRLYEGYRTSLIEITNDSFPLTFQPPQGEIVGRSDSRDEYHRKFFRDVDAALKAITNEDALPVIVVGVERWVSFFNEVSTHKQPVNSANTQRSVIIGEIRGGYDKTSPHELAKLTWPLMDAYIRAHNHYVLEELAKAVNERRFVSGVGEAWRLAHEGRGAVLVVEKGYMAPARVDATRMHITLTDDRTAHGAQMLDDAVDEIIEKVIELGGEVIFVDPGTLSQHQQIALITRY